MERVRLVSSTITNGAVAKAAQVLAAGGVILYPTDTVYGLGADATNNAAVAKIRAIKQRTHAKPILASVSDVDMMEQYALVTPLARELARTFWPGPLSLVLEARNRSALAPGLFSQGAIGFRCPKYAFCTEVARVFGRPITSTSANLSGVSQASDLDSMLSSLKVGSWSIDLIIDAGVLPASLPSTVVDARDRSAAVLREGAISSELLRPFL